MTIEGRLSIGLHRQKGKITHVDIRSSRPVQAARILEGKEVGETLKLLPRMFSVCAIAQSGAAVKACQQALGLQPDAAVEAARDMLMLMEMAREHLWRIALDWPRVLGESAEPARASSLSGLLKDSEAALFGVGRGFCLGAELSVNLEALMNQLSQLQSILDAQVFGQPPEVWLDNLDVGSWQDWAGRGETPASRLVGLVHHLRWRRAGSVATAFLPQMSGADLHERLSGDSADTFVSQPDWNGEYFETTSFMRQSGHPLIAALIEEHGSGIETRLAAKLVELASIPACFQRLLPTLSDGEAGRQPSEKKTADGSGVGQVEAARGRLVHWLELENERVKSYRILAPTEWNFHPQGVVARALQALPGEDDEVLHRMAGLLIETIDPCVGYELTLH